MKKLILTLATVSFVNFSFSQCEYTLSNFTFDWSGGELTASYCGEINARGERNGQGKLTYNNPDFNIHYQEGNWKNGKLEGYAKVVNRDGDEFQGTFIKGKLTSGTYIRNLNNISIKYEGLFNGIYYQGKGFLKTENNQNVITQDGTFISDRFANGIEIKTSKIDGVIIKSNYIDGIPTITERNDINTYKRNDIIGDSKFTEINLIQRGSAIDARLAYDLELQIDGIKGEFLFDTGAMGFTIGMIMFDRLKEGNINYQELNREVTSFGVGGSAVSDLIVIREIQIGDYVVKNVVATVSKSHNYSIIGTGFLLKFSEVIWKMKENKLLLYK
ncbi:aspartyl protease family protein [Bacteroidota bacterium]|nr:aspartyl protease family protein [Bacteroidota bacterium]